ncbi:MAG: autoinducer 2 ABC transporter substrate-binding protein [Oscillospiraceae bacterium]|nr:autoinducer 2 ABC transporter substrate-binding protein [Oscillospiraceae bacterium]
MKKILALMMAMVLVFGVAACGGGSAPAPAAPAAPAEQPAESAPAEPAAPVASDKDESDWEIVVVPKDASNPWFVRMDVGVKEYAQKTGLNIYQRGTADIDATLQAQLIQDLIASGVDAICVVPVDPGSLEPVLKQARDAGIIVIAHEGASLVNVDYNIEAFSNDQYGAFIMDNLAEAMGEEGVYTTMVAHVTNASHNEWADGGVAHQKVAYPNMTLLEAEPRVESEDNGDIAYNTALELFKKYPDLKGIMGTSSFDAPGVARAIEELGLTGKAFTSGTGLPADNAALLRSGAVQSLTLWDPALAGQAMAALAVHMLRGLPVTDHLDLGVEGYTDLVFKPGSTTVLEGQGWIVINAENVDSFGF